jgi:hypothetical protein
MPLSRVVEGGLALNLHGDGVPHYAHASNQALTVAGLLKNRHEIQHLGHSLRREKAGEEYVDIREIKLLTARVVQGFESEVTALLIVEDGSEDTRGIEARQTKPVYGAVCTNERGGAQVPYDPVVIYLQVRDERSLL